MYECKPSNMPEDICPEKFVNGKCLVCRIGKSEKDFEEMPLKELFRKNLIARRMKDKDGYTWEGQHPLYWDLI